MQILGILTGLVSLGCLIFVLTKLFPAKGPGWGIFGIICGIYTFIWGWQNANNYENMRNVMIVWTVAIVLGIIFNMMATNAA